MSLLVLPAELSYNQTELLGRIAEGDSNAFTIIFHQHKQLVYNVAWTYTEDKKLSEDILQDVFVILWKNRKKIEEIKDLSAYLYVIAKNRAVRVLKNLEKIQHEADLASSFGALHATEQSRVSEYEMHELLAEALERLSPQQRKVFELCRMQGLSREEAANQLNISKATVSVHLTIAIRQVRAFLVTHLELAVALILFPEFF